jgi:hypothetical protein
MIVLGLSLDWSGVGALTTAAIAAIALLVAKKELRANHVANVQEIYKEFLTESLKYPQFIYPDPKVVDPSKNLFDGERPKFWHYEVYVDLMLTAFEELFELWGADEKLKAYIGGYLYSHEKYLCSPYFTKHFVVEMDSSFWTFAQDALEREKAKW